jgi:hypothetical protein
VGREAPPWGGQTSGEEEDAGIGERRLVLFPDLGFHRISKGRLRERAGWRSLFVGSRSSLAPFVIGSNREGAGDKKSNRSDGCGETWAGNFTVWRHPTIEKYAERWDS